MFKTIFLAYIRRLKRDDLSTYAAQIAFFSILSIVPFLLLISMWLGNTDLLDLPGLLTMIENTGALPQSGIDLLRSVLVGLEGSVGLFSLSALMVFWSSSRMIRSVMTGIHMAYRERDSRSIILKYLYSILYTILLSIGIVLILVMPVFGERIWAMFYSLGFDDRVVELVWTLCRMIVPVIILLIIFWSLYTVLPIRKVSVLDSLPGALLSTVALLVVSQVFSFFVNNGNGYSVLYGGLSSFTAILLWFYLFGYILMLGMELNAVMAELPEYQSYRQTRRQLRARQRQTKKLRRQEAKVSSGGSDSNA